MGNLCLDFARGRDSWGANSKAIGINVQRNFGGYGGYFAVQTKGVVKSERMEPGGPSEGFISEELIGGRRVGSALISSVARAKDLAG